jgi:hypothetical protein
VGQGSRGISYVNNASEAADFVKYARYVMGFDPVEEYIYAMHGREVVQHSLTPKEGNQILQYYNFEERQVSLEIRKLAYEFANSKNITLNEDASILELIGTESIFREFIL